MYRLISCTKQLIIYFCYEIKSVQLINLEICCSSWQLLLKMVVSDRTLQQDYCGHGYKPDLDEIIANNAQNATVW